MNDETALQAAIDEIIEPRLAEIRCKAEELIAGHKAAIRAENARRPEYRDHAQLVPYITLNDGGYVYIYWSRYSGWRTEGARRLRNTRQLRTSKGGDYPESTLRRNAKQWEVERVLATEQIARALRRKQKHLGETRMALTKLIVSIRS